MDLIHAIDPSREKLKGIVHTPLHWVEMAIIYKIEFFPTTPDTMNRIKDDVRKTLPVLMVL